MTRRAIVVAIAAGFLLATPKHAAAKLQVAVTFDDLPGGVAELEAVGCAVASHGIGATYGFVNGGQLEGKPEGRAALTDWVRAGNLLGNHTYSHAALDQLGLTRYLADLDRNEPLLAELSFVPESWRVFRYPFLLEGLDRWTKAAIREHLHARDYRVAEVTIDFYDWAFDGAYNRCVAAGDTDAVRALEARYLEDARTYLHWADTVSHELVGRTIAHILLVHVRTMTAKLADALFRLYEAEGVEFVPLDQAMADPVYAESTGRILTGTFLRQLARARPDIGSTPMPEHPTGWLDSLCKTPL